MANKFLASIFTVLVGYKIIQHLKAGEIHWADGKLVSVNKNVRPRDYWFVIVVEIILFLILFTGIIVLPE